MSTPPTDPSGTVVVLGAGYAGLFAARRAAQLRRLGSPKTDVRIVLVDREPAWTERTRWHQLAAGETVASWPLTSLFRGTGVEVVQATVTSIDLSRRIVHVADDGAALAFDRLVYTLGSHPATSAVPGADEHVDTLASPASSRVIGAKMTLRPHSRVTVVGGGLTGIQTAAQIADRYPSARIALVNSGALAHEFTPPARSYVAQSLQRRGIEVFASRVTAVDAAGCQTEHGSIGADMVVWAAGFVPSESAAAAGLEVTEQHQVVVDAHLRSISHPFVYAAGDAAAVSRAASPFGAYAATASGATAGRNALLDILGRPLTALDLGYPFVGVSLGRRDAVVQLLEPDGTPRRRLITGRVAHLMKEGVERYVSGAVRAERRLSGVYRWSPATN